MTTNLVLVASVQKLTTTLYSTNVYSKKLHRSYINIYMNSVSFYYHFTYCMNLVLLVYTLYTFISLSISVSPFFSFCAWSLSFLFLFFPVNENKLEPGRELASAETFLQCLKNKVSSDGFLLADCIDY